MQDNSAARSAKHWDFFAGEATRQRAPLYARLALGIRDDEALTALAATGEPSVGISIFLNMVAVLSRLFGLFMRRLVFEPSRLLISS